MAYTTTKKAKKQIKNVYKGRRLAIVFLLICDGKQTLPTLAGHLKMKSDSSLQLYLKQLMDCNLILRERKELKWQKTRANLFVYSPNFVEFSSLTIRGGKIEHSGQKFPFIPFAKEFLPAFAEYYFNEKPALKKALMKDINILTIVEIFNSAVAQYLTYYKENKTKEETFYLHILMAQFLNPVTSLIKVDSIFSPKDEKTGEKKQLEINEDTVYSTASQIESEIKRIKENNYFEEILKKIKGEKKVIIAGPGLTKNNFKKFRENKNIKLDAIFESTDSTGKTGLNELVKKGIIKKAIESSGSSSLLLVVLDDKEAVIVEANGNKIRAKATIKAEK